METLAMEFMFRCCQLRMDGKCLFSIIEISHYEFDKFISYENQVKEEITYHFMDGSKCRREYSSWHIL